jgi:hypothetical protein
MKIKKIISQSQRDFSAIYECEHCVSIFCENLDCSADISWVLLCGGYDPKEYRRKSKNNKRL